MILVKRKLAKTKGEEIFVLVFWDARLAYLATPKTGSTALELALEPLSALSALRPPALKHTNLVRYHRFLAPWLKAASGDDFEVVAMIREPLDWLGSWYRYRRRDDLKDARRSTKHVDFDQFVRAWCLPDPPQWANVGSQARMLKASRNGQWLDHLFRYEDMDGFADFLRLRLKLDFTLSRTNVSPEGDLDLSPATQKLFRTTAADDLWLHEKLRPKH